MHKKKKYLAYTIVLFLFVGMLFSCKKADQFYEQLDGLLQVDQRPDYAYRTSYVVGDTIQIYGRLKADQNLEVWINGAKGAITAKETVQYFTSERDTAYMDHVSVLIGEDMVGNNLQVELRNGDLRGMGSAIDVLSYYGESSFQQELTNELIYTFPDRTNIFLYCASGKGDVYYYAQTDKQIRHIAKDGTATVLIDLSTPLPNGDMVQEFLAGGADPGNQNLYFSVRTNNGYGLYRLALATKSLTLLNESQAINKPFAGKLDEVNIVVTSVYPDKDGNLYIGIGSSALNHSGSSIHLPAALAYFNNAGKSFSYIYKWDGDIPGLPAELLPQNTLHRDWRINPDEKRLYIFSYRDDVSATAIEVYDLSSRIKLSGATFAEELSGKGDPFNFVATFPNLRLNIMRSEGYNPDLCFGFMPMPGNRLQSLLYQYYNHWILGLASAHEFPKWTVFDFNDNRTYAYAKGKFDRGSYVFNPTTYLFPKNSYTDELLNWDEDGHLYMSSNGKKVLIKTKAR